MKSLLLPLLIAACAPALHAATIVNVSFTADGSSRFYDPSYNVYAQLSLGDNLWAIRDGWVWRPDSIIIFHSANEHAGTAVVFPAGGNWSNVGSFTLNGTATGVGVETFSITGTSFNFGQYIRYDDSPLTQAFGNYTTLIDPSATGTIQLTDGVVTDLSFVGSLLFAYNYPDSQEFMFLGMLQIDENGFDLHVLPGSGLDGYGYGWDATGSSSFGQVPEPSVAMLGLLAGAAAIRRRRR